MSLVLVRSMTQYLESSPQSGPGLAQAILCSYSEDISTTWRCAHKASCSASAQHRPCIRALVSKSDLTLQNCILRPVIITDVPSSPKSLPLSTLSFSLQTARSSRAMVRPGSPLLLTNLDSCCFCQGCSNSREPRHTVCCDSDAFVQPVSQPWRALASRNSTLTHFLELKLSAGLATLSGGVSRQQFAAPAHASRDSRHGEPSYRYQVARVNFPDEANVNKGKKSWGERLKLGRGVDKDRPVPHQAPRDADNNPYLLQEYRNKYGTLSGGSALSKSMKYAETWLYGSVSGPPGSKRLPSETSPLPLPPPPATGHRHTRGEATQRRDGISRVTSVQLRGRRVFMPRIPHRYPKE
uniref:(California timema) hypothetical protein n=1 Tax=Timema californicum TaxID=61474 RepID=A0A7R9J0N1_TIMCA|nr:unnamed protein product [Timema californicum]